MSAGQWLAAIACGGIFVGCGLVVALAVRQAFFGSWRGSEGAIVVALVWIGWALALGQALGAVGLLRRGALLVAAVITAGAGLFLPVGATPPPRPDPGVTDPSARRPSSAVVAATSALVLLVAALWVARTVILVHRGLNDPDSLGYHLPFAVTFAQTGYANQHLYVLPSFPVHFYPANDELLPAVALALTHSLVFATVKNLLFAGLALVAAHALGKAFGAGLLAVAGAAVVLGLPVIAFTQPGEAVNDTLLILVVLGGLAVLAHARHHPAPYILALAAAGAAAGIKFSGVAAAVALALFTLVLLAARLRTHRWRWAAAGGLAAVAMGGSWYLRNAITYGNPVPPSRVALGPIHLHQITTELGARSSTALGFLVRGQYYGELHQGLRRGLGPLFLVVIGCWLVGVIGGLFARDGFRRGLSLFALAAAIGYLATPASAFGLDGALHDPSGFVINLHYGAVALVAGLVACGLRLARSRLALVFSLLGSAVVATSIRPGQTLAAYWSPEIGGRAFDWLVAAALVGAAAVVLTRWPDARRLAQVGAAVAGVAALIGLVLVAPRYARLAATDPVVRWAAQHRGARIVGWAPDAGLLYGPGAKNRVVTLTRTVNDAPVQINSCPAWMAAVIGGHYQWSAALPGSIWSSWLNRDPAFRRVARDLVVVVFEVVGTPDVSCGGRP